MSEAVPLLVHLVFASISDKFAYFGQARIAQQRPSDIPLREFRKATAFL